MRMGQSWLTPGFLTITGVVEMRLRPAASGEFVVLPQGDELFRGHGAARAGKTAV